MKKKNIILPVIIALLTVSCNSWLDVRPKTMEPAEIMFDTYQGYKDALTGCYMKMKDRSLWGEHMTITSVEFLAQHWQFGDYTPSATMTEGKAIKKYDYADDNVKPVFQNMYNGLYNIIVQANTIVEAMPKTGATAILDQQARGVVEGEAYAIRAMCHFEILRLFGQVPKNAAMAPISLPYITAVSREPVAYIDYGQFVEKVENDLAKAAELLGKHDPYMEYTYKQVNGLNNTWEIADEFLRYRLLRLNYWAVKGLQARFYLYVGNTAKAAAAANEVIEASVDGRGFSTESNTGELTPYNGTSYCALPGEGLFMLSNYQLKDYNPTLFCTPGALMELRLHMSAARMEGASGVFGLFGEPLAATTNNRFKGVWRMRTHPQWADPTIFELLKYEQSDASAWGTSLVVQKQVMPMLRLSEMYLIAMETSDDIARINELYNTYRTARNITGTTFSNKQDVMAMIEKEYRREFFGEGQMFFYYKRNNAKSMVWAEKAITEANYRIPLPATEYQLNGK